MEPLAAYHRGMSELLLTGLKRGRDSVSWEELSALPGIVGDTGSVGNDAAGEAVPITAIVDLAEPRDDAAYCSVVSADGSYTASIPLADLRDGGWLAFRLSNAPLPAEMGGPMRLTVTRGRTLCWNVKDVGELRFTASKEPDSVPARSKH